MRSRRAMIQRVATGPSIPPTPPATAPITHEDHSVRAPKGMMIASIDVTMTAPMVREVFQWTRGSSVFMPNPSWSGVA